MRKVHPATLVALAASTALLGAGVGCGAPDCTETATCADPADGSTRDRTGDVAPGACDPNAPDCSNPRCQQGFMCTAKAPPGWFGPVALFEQGGGPPGPTAARCTGTYDEDAFDGNSNPTSPAASCTCSCGSALGICTNPSIAVFGDNVCLPANQCGAGGSPTCTVADSSSCSNGGQSAEVTTLPQPTGGGSCAAGFSQAGLPTSQWTHTGRGCASSRAFATGGCPAQQVCADKPTSAFTPAVCVWKNANPDCSSATGYPLPHVYYTGVLDTRGCSLGTCGCGSPGSVSCTLTRVTTYTTPVCSDTGSNLPDLAVGHCNAVGMSQISGVTTAVSGTAQCGPTGSAASTGSVSPDPTTAVTVCCSQ